MAIAAAIAQGCRSTNCAMKTPVLATMSTHPLPALAPRTSAGTNLPCARQSATTTAMSPA